MRVDVDIHNMSELDALKHLERFISKVNNDVTEIRVIHGYHGGDSLQGMVRDRNKLRSKKIYRRKLTMNQGETILELY